MINEPSPRFRSMLFIPLSEILGRLGDLPNSLVWSRLSFTRLVAALLFALGTAEAAPFRPDPGNRVKLSLGDTGWKFIKDDPYPQAKEPSFDDQSWETVGIPHCFNDTDTYLNIRRGYDKPFMGPGWYRKHFKLDSSFKDRKVFIEFEGVNVAAAVYVNGKFVPGNSHVPNQEATHVHGFIGFVVDVSDLVKFGAEENTIAVRVCNGEAPWFVSPGFGTRFMFSMGMGGIFRPVNLIVTDRVYVPLNVYSVVQKWGTHVATVSADENSARISVKTNVENEYPLGKEIELTTTIADANQQVVWSTTDSARVAAGKNGRFSQLATLAKPQRWYPAWSPYGKPYLYTVYSSVKVDGKVVDLFQSQLGIRVITWDNQYPWINGQKHCLWGFGQRYEYPALGSAVPEEQQWRDIGLMTGAGGRFVRPGHCASSPETVAACDAYGVMMAQPSGDNEYLFQKPSATDLTLKKELHRDLMIRDRNHPSILMWEDDNGCSVPGLVADLVKITEEWDSVQPRMNSPRDQHGVYKGDLIPGKTVLGQCNGGRPISWIKPFEGKAENKEAAAPPFPSVPTWNAEAWIARDARHHWENEVKYSEMFYNSWLDQKDNGKIFAYAQWYLSETQGEDCETLVGVEDPAMKAAMQKDLTQNGKVKVQGRSLGCSAMDGNRIPKLIYKIWRNALWIPFEERPGVTLQSHWNLTGTVNVDAWSNCPGVELFLNGVSQGTREPKPGSGRCTWEGIPWQAGVLRVEGKDSNQKTVCTNERETAGKPHHILLSVEPALKRPDGFSFPIHANGSDAGFVLATIVDEKGRWCPLAENNLTFAVRGPGVYRGSYNFWATAGQPLHYHAPCDPELQAEGGMMKVAIRSTFLPGTVTVTATSPGLEGGSANFTTVAIPVVKGIETK